MIDSDKGGWSILTMNLLDIYYTSCGVECQVNLWGPRTSHELARNGRRGPAKTTAGKHGEKEVSGYQEGGRLATKGTKEKRA